MFINTAKKETLQEGTLLWARFTTIFLKNAISKVALFQYYAKSIHAIRDKWPEWTVDISLTHKVHKSGIFKVASQHASIHYKQCNF